MERDGDYSPKGWNLSGFFSDFFDSVLPRAPHMVGSGLSLPKILCQNFGMQYSPPGGAGRSHEQKNHEMAKKPPFFDGFLPPDRLLDLQYGLMGHRCDRWSKIVHTHSSGGGRGHIKASRAS